MQCYSLIGMNKCEFNVEIKDFKGLPLSVWLFYCAGSSYVDYNCTAVRMPVAVCFLLAGLTPPLHHKLLRKYLLSQLKVSDSLYPNPLWWPPADISEAGYEEWRHLEWHLDWILQSEVLAQMQARTTKRMPQLTLQSKVEHLFFPSLSL